MPKLIKNDMAGISENWWPHLLRRSADDVVPNIDTNDEQDTKNCKLRDYGENMVKRGRYVANIHISYNWREVVHVITTFLNGTIRMRGKFS